MPGCLSCIVAKDSADENVIWVTEVWDSIASHDAFLSLPAVKNVIPRAKGIVSNFEKIAVLSHPRPIVVASDSFPSHGVSGSCGHNACVPH